jgi:hypothetical protein
MLMYTRKTALALAIQARTCPLPDIVDDPAHAQQNRQHLAICPFCSTRRSHELDACRELARSLGKKNSPFPKPPPIEPGQIWRIDPALTCWRDHFYYSPPAVVVVKKPEPGNPGLLAAQIWHDIFLAGPADLVVTPEDSPYNGQIFIETWNVYTLKEPYLTHYLGRISPGQTTDILRMNQDPKYLPPDAMALLPLEENDPRHYFRKMEIETGYTFARAAAHDLMNQLPRDDVTALLQQIRHIFPDITFSWSPGTVEECFATLEFPAESLALAAADQDHKKIVATHFRLAPHLEQTLITRITPFYCVIYNETTPPEDYTVSGTLTDLHFDLEKTRFSCFLSDKTARTLVKGTIRIDPENHTFFATFPRPKSPSESLCILADESPGTEP